MHTDPELLALLALGEPAATEADQQHLRSCPACAAELAGLRQVVALGREAADLVVTSPGPQVWAAVRAGMLALPVDGGATLDEETVGHVSRTARLAPVRPQWSGASGEAELVTDRSGRRLLRVALHADLPTEGIRQAWLVHRDDPTRRQTLGILDAGRGLWTVDRSLDLDEFATLDISEQRVGSTEHSGRTVVRGELVRVA